MRTRVIQSYRTRDVAAWIHLCLGSVQAWAAAAGYQYEFVDDRLFDYAPGWVGAANLCASLQDKPSAGAIVGVAEMQAAVDMLLRSRGDVLNAHLVGMVSAA